VFYHFVNCYDLVHDCCFNCQVVNSLTLIDTINLLTAVHSIGVVGS